MLTCAALGWQCCGVHRAISLLSLTVAEFGKYMLLLLLHLSGAVAAGAVIVAVLLRGAVAAVVLGWHLAFDI